MPEPETPETGLTLEQAQDALKKARAEAAERRVKANELEAEIAKRDQAAKDAAEAEAKKRGEFEKLAEEKAKELETFKRSQAQKESRLKDRLVEEAIRARLSDAVDPDVALLIDRKAIVVGDDYAISGVDDAVKAFREAKPALFKAPADATATNGGTSRGIGPASNGNGLGNVTKLDFLDKTVPLDQLVAQARAAV